MATHKLTMDDWTGDGKTWIWYEGLDSELTRMAEEARAKFGDDFEEGPPLHASGNNRDLAIPFMKTFVFARKDQAMVFRLSH
jgi:hypothetical protein